ncbi:MAG: DUF4867 family protein [Clostridiales bacterium]|nr:DUF4867 family protein [Clostridiales bacterium]
MKLLSVNSPAFAPYGKVLTGIDLAPLVEALSQTPIPEGVDYIASVPELEATASMAPIQSVAYGELPVQIGYCNGHNHLLNAVEYHRCPELNIAATDAILILGRQQDIAPDFSYETAKMEAFLVPAGTGVEIYGTTLHYAPCGVDGKGFQVAIVLPRGTNGPLTVSHGGDGEDKLLAANNKWLIGHAQGGLPEGSFSGLGGENLDTEK